MILLKKLFPYILILVLGVSLYAIFISYSNKIESISKENQEITEKLNISNTNYDLLNNTVDIIYKQNEELEKNKKDSIESIESIKIKIDDSNIIDIYNNDKDMLLDKINQYEKCYSRNLIFNPENNCNVDKLFMK